MAINALKKDKLILGIVVGILVPILALYVQYLIKDYADSFVGYLKVITQKPYLNLFSAATSLSLIANGLLFGILIQVKKYETARGVFIITVLYGVGVLVFKFV